VTRLGQSADTVRRALRGLYLLTAVGLVAELLLIGHTEKSLQVLPLVLISAGSVVVVRSRPPVAIRITSILMVACGALGLILHGWANLEFAQELSPGLGGFALFWKAIQGAAPPTLAPGALFSLGLLGWLTIPSR